MSREKNLLNRLSAVQFALWETHMFLDTHPGNKEARRMHESYQKKFEALRKEYEETCGPLTLSGENSDEWVKNPWPWDVEHNNC